MTLEKIIISPIACVIIHPMADDVRLVGGTFVTILEQYRKYKDENRQKILKGKFVSAFFVALGFDEKDCGDFSTAQATHFTRCDSGTFEESFINTSNLDSLAFSISKHWKDVSIFFEKFMTDNAAMKVVAALKEMIESDKKIKDTDRFLLSEDESITKKDVSKIPITVPYIPFITGVAIFALKKNNSEGGDTILKWCNHVAKAPARTDVGKKYWGKISNDVTYVDRILSLDGTNGEESLYDIDEADYKALEAQAENEERDQRDLFDLLNSIDRNKNLYVKTNVYRETYNKLLEKGYVLLTGNPGTGKSMTSELVALKFAGTGKYIVHYLQGIDESKVKNVYNIVSGKEAKNEFHFILIDDCMGQAVYKLSEEKESCLTELVAYIKRKTNRVKLLLNSRISIIKEAREHRIYGNVISEMEKAGTIIYANNLSNKEKALILRSHLFELTDEAHYNSLGGWELLEIVKHKPFIPRVIRHVMDRDRIHPINTPDEFFYDIMVALCNPRPVWDKIYTKYISKESKILLEALYSLTDTTVDTECCRFVFNAYLHDEGVDDDPNRAFRDAVEQLNGSMVMRIINRVDMIGFADPSVHNYLSHTVYYENSKAYKSLCHCIVHRNQIDKVFGVVDSFQAIDALVADGGILKLVYSREEIRALEVFGHISSGRYCLEPYKKIFNETLKKFRNPGVNFYAVYSIITSFSYQRSGLEMLVSLMKDKNMRDFYCGGKISRYIFDCCTYQFDLNYVADFLSKVYENDISCFDFAFDAEVVKTMTRRACSNTILNPDEDILDLTDVLDYDSNKLDEYNERVNSGICAILFELPDSLGSNVPKEVKESMLEEMNNYDFTKDYREDIVNFYEVEQNSEDEEGTLKEEIVASDYDDSDKAILEVFDVPFPRKEQ